MSKIDLDQSYKATQSVGFVLQSSKLRNSLNFSNGLLFLETVECPFVLFCSPVLHAPGDVPPLLIVGRPPAQRVGAALARAVERGVQVGLVRQAALAARQPPLGGVKGGHGAAPGVRVRRRGGGVRRGHTDGLSVVLSGRLLKYVRGRTRRGY